jgi:hypothetical protein
VALILASPRLAADRGKSLQVRVEIIGHVITVDLPSVALGFERVALMWEGYFGMELTTERISPTRLNSKPRSHSP